MSPKDRWEPDDPVPVSAALNQLMKQLKKPSVPVISAIFDRWPVMVGSELARISRPVSVAESTVTIEVDDPAAATQLRWLKADLVASIRSMSGSSEVTNVEIVLTRRSRANLSDPPDDHR